MSNVPFTRPLPQAPRADILTPRARDDPFATIELRIRVDAGYVAQLHAFRLQSHKKVSDVVKEALDRYLVGEGLPGDPGRAPSRAPSPAK